MFFRRITKGALLSLFFGSYLTTNASAETWVEIKNLAELKEFAQKVNTNDPIAKSQNVRLMADITISDNDHWAPIGAGETSSTGFHGKFDGQGHIITFDDVNATCEHFGVFGHCWQATIENLNTSGTIHTAYNQTGGIVGLIGASTIKSCGSDVNIYSTFVGDGYDAGIVAYIQTTPSGYSYIQDCYFSGLIDGGGVSTYLSGLAGYSTTNNHYIKNCLMAGTLQNVVTGGALHAIRTGYGTAESYKNNHILDPDGSLYDTNHYDYAFKVNHEQLANGEVCYYLDVKHDGTWGQQLGVDAQPRPNHDKVYLFNADCTGNIRPYCSNNNNCHIGTDIHSSAEKEVCSACETLYTQGLTINEIMQSNVDFYYSEHDFSDSWVELYNPTHSDIDINGYSLGSSANTESAYKFPTHAIVPALGYLIISCDKKGARLHTDFRLESTDPGELFLFDATGSIIDRIQYPAMIAPNVAYGRVWDGLNNWGWEMEPTPGTINTGKTSEILLPDPVFNVSGTLVQDEYQRVRISIPEGNYPTDTKIYYTTDGQEPTKASAAATYFSFKVTNSTVVRAKLISDFAISRPSVTRSFIFHPIHTDLPVVSIASNDDYLYGSSNGILSNSITVMSDEQYLYSNQDFHLTECATIGQENYWYNWRRPANFEYLNGTAENLAFNQIGEMAVAGWASREYAQKSMKLYANKRFGTKRFSGQFWNDKPHVKKSKSFMLRNGGQNSDLARFNDGILQTMFGTHLTNMDYQAYRPAIVYINGEYKGIFGLRERSDENYVEANFDGLEDIAYATEMDYRTATTRSKEFESFYQLYTKTSTTYEQMSEAMDIENFKEVLIAEMFASNTDYPHNNISMWRPLAAGGKWRWIVKDVDYFGHENYRNPKTFNMFKYMFGNATPEDENESKLGNRELVIQASRLYKKMISFDEFRESFIDSYTTYLGDFLKPSITTTLAKKMDSEIRNELKSTFATYNYELANYDNYLNEMLTYCNDRPRIIYQQMADYFSLGTVIPMTLQPNGSSVTINGIGLTEGNFDGAYYSARQLNLSTGSNAKSWILKTYRKNAEGVMNEEQKITFKAPDISIMLNEYEACDSVSFATYVIAPSEFDLKLEELAINQGDCTCWTSQSTITIDEPKYAYINVTNVDRLPETKYDNLQAIVDFYDNNGNYFQKKVLLNRQGSSEPKLNLSFQFCEDEWIGSETPNITFGNWVAQDEFHLKGFEEDGLRGSAEIAYQLYAQITERDKCYPQAFPVSLYINGKFYGIMAWQLKKQRANMNLAKDNGDHVWLDGKVNDKQLFQGNINWTKFEVRNPKDLYNMDGTDYDGDYPQEIIDSSSSAWTGKNKMVRAETAKNHIIALSHYSQELSDLKTNGATKEEMREAIQLRFDVNEIINYKIFSLVTNNYDGFSDNWQWFTYDGTQWTVAPYDCNLTFGYNEDGTTLWPADKGSNKYDYKMENTDTDGPMPWIKEYFWEDLKARYAELREQGIISTSNILSLASNWYNRIGDNNYELEWNTWPESPCVTGFTESISRLESWVAQRIKLEDEYLGYTPISDTYTLAITNARWSTICVPFAFDVPVDLDVYSVKEIMSDGETLALERIAYPLANKPYLLYGPAGAKYTLKGEIVHADPAAPDYLTNGMLVGTLSDTYAPADSYVLQNLSQGVGFYHVSTNNTIKVKANRAYVKPVGSRFNGRFRLVEDETNSILELADDVQSESYYNFWGQQVDSQKSGFMIRRMPDGTYRKVLIRK